MMIKSRIRWLNRYKATRIPWTAHSFHTSSSEVCVRHQIPEGNCAQLAPVRRRASPRRVAYHASRTTAGWVHPTEMAYPQCKPYIAHIHEEYVWTHITTIHYIINIYIYSTYYIYIYLQFLIWFYIMYACRHFCFWMTHSCHHIFHCSHELTSAMKPERLQVVTWPCASCGSWWIWWIWCLNSQYIDDWLVVYLPLWKMMDFVNGKDDIPYIYIYYIYIMENKKNAWNILKPPTSYTFMIIDEPWDFEIRLWLHRGVERSGWSLYPYPAEKTWNKAI